MGSDVVHNPSASRFEITEDGSLGILDYVVSGRRITFVHTGVPPELEGRGLGSRLARAGLEYAKREGLSVVPRCPFVRSYIKRHAEYQALLA